MQKDNSIPILNQTLNQITSIRDNTLTNLNVNSTVNLFHEPNISKTQRISARRHDPKRWSVGEEFQGSSKRENFYSNITQVSNTYGLPPAEEYGDFAKLKKVRKPIFA